MSPIRAHFDLLQTRDEFPIGRVIVHELQTTLLHVNHERGPKPAQILIGAAAENHDSNVVPTTRPRSQISGRLYNGSSSFSLFLRW